MLRGALCAAGAAHQPNTAEDQHHADQYLGDLIHHQVKCPERNAVVPAAPHQLIQDAHNDLLVGDEHAGGDQAPAQQLMALGEELPHPPVVPVYMDQVIVLGGIAGADLYPQVEGIKKAVHPHDQAGDGQRRQQHPTKDGQAEHAHQRQAPLHIALVHLTSARDAGKDQSQDSVFHCVFSPLDWS